MKFSLVCVLFLIFVYTPGFAQKKISGRSNKIKFTISPDYKRGLPPNLFLKMNFKDANDNGILEAYESANLDLKITNKGKGPAQGLVVKINNNNNNLGLLINDNLEIPYIHSGQQVTASIPIKANQHVKSQEHKLEISVSEHFGYDMDPAFLILNTFEFQGPELKLSGINIIDKGDGLMSILEDGQVQAGEMVKVKFLIQNIGQGVSKNTIYEITTTDQNIYIPDSNGELGDIETGQVKEFWATITPNKRVTTKGKLPIYLTLKNDYKFGEIEKLNLPIELNQRPPQTKIVSVKPNLEQLTKQVARFEYTSKKITSNVGKVIDITQVVPSKTKRPNSIGILIGIEKYNYFAPAPYATNDVDIMKEYCKNILGVEQVFTYTNEEVNGFFFENTFNPDFGELQKAIIKGETELFIFYSGHGMPSKSGDQVFLFPFDGRIEALELQGYNVNKFYNHLNELEAKNTTVFVDACFSGMSRKTESFETKNLVSMKGVRIKPEIIQPWENNPTFSVFSSSDFNETSLGFDQSKTGLFTYFLCAGLQGEADSNKDKKITNGELSHYVINRVKSMSQKLIGLQSPQFFGNKDQVLAEY